MPSIQGGGGFIPRPIQSARPQQTARVQQQAAQETGSKDVARFQAAPSQTSLSSQIAQRLTSDATRAQIHQLIQQNQVQVPEQKPQLQMMQRPAMSSALAETLAGHHVPDQAQNAQAQQAAGSMGASYQTKTTDHTEDTVRRRSLQSGKRLRKEDQEGEFSSLDDMGGGDSMSGDQSGQDQRSDSQKQKHLLDFESDAHGKTGKVPLQRLGQKPTSLKPNLHKFAEQKGVAKPAVQRLQNLKPAPPKKKPDDEWTI